MTVLDRIMQRSVVDETTNCRVWNGAVCPSGHAVISFRGNAMKAHRALWIETFGELDSKTVVRHLCNNPRCTNLEHLAIGTQSENIQDMIDSGRHGMSNKTHCPRGHEYTASNTRVYRGRRWCRACDNERSRMRAAKGK